jgi:hypothetical protein
MKTCLRIIPWIAFVLFTIASRGQGTQSVPCIKYTYTCPAEFLSSTLNNGSFEQQLSGWSYNNGVFYIGQAGTQPIGVDGNYAADLGGADIAGAKMWQSVAVTPGGQYELSFYSCGNGSGYAGRTAVSRVEIEDAAGVIIASLNFTNISPTPMLGTNGFVARKLSFGVGPASSCLTLRFVDLTPNGGVGVDVAIDAVVLKKVTSYDGVGTRCRAGITLQRSRSDRQTKTAAQVSNDDGPYYAAITIEGPSAGNYRVECTDDIAVGKPPEWLVLTNVSVPEVPYIFIDESRLITESQMRFYRIVFLP